MCFRATRRVGWPLPDGDWPVELYVPESDLIEILEAHRLEPATELPADIVLYAVPDPWPFPPHLRLVPEIVAALDLAEAMAPSLAALGRVRLADLADGLELSWQLSHLAGHGKIPTPAAVGSSGRVG